MCQRKGTSDTTVKDDEQCEKNKNQKNLVSSNLEATKWYVWVKDFEVYFLVFSSHS